MVMFEQQGICNTVIVESEKNQKYIRSFKTKCIAVSSYLVFAFKNANIK